MFENQGYIHVRNEPVEFKKIKTDEWKIRMLETILELNRQVISQNATIIAAITMPTVMIEKSQEQLD